MREQFKRFVFILCIFIFSTFSYLAAQNLTVRLDPQSQTAEPNQTISLNIAIENVSNLGGFQVDIYYDTDIVQAEAATLGDLLGSTGRSPFPLGPEMDNSTNPGKITFGGATFGSGAGPDGGGVLAIIEFTTIALGNSAIDLQNVQISDVNGQSLTVASVNDAEIIVQSGDIDEIIVINTNDNGEGSLRWALEQANSNAGPDVIIFKIPQTDTNYDQNMGTWTLKLQTPLQITDDSLLIDANSQASFMGTDTNPFGPEIVINGQNATEMSSGLVIISSYNTVRGLVINGFDDSGILLNGNWGQVKENNIWGNYIGTNAAGTDTVPNFSGITILNASHNVIGGTDASARNLISGNRWYGIFIDGDQSSDNYIIGNYIGTDATSIESLGNGNVGIYLKPGTHKTTIGGKQPGEANVISGNGTEGIRLWGHHNTVLGNYIGTDISGKLGLGNYDGISLMAGADYNIIGGTQPGQGNVVSANTVRGIVVVSDFNQIAGNYIGTDATGTEALGNNNEGISLTYGAKNNTIGPANIISNNGWAGVDVITDSSVQNTITKNSIFQNSGQGINNWNGGNAELSPPQITNFSGGMVTGTAPANSTVEIFSDDNDEGKIYEGTVSADNNGNFQWTGSPTGPYLTATATDAAGNTSEFSSPYSITSVQEKTKLQVTQEFILEQNYPNPFNPETEIKYTLPRSANVEISVYNLQGRRIVMLVKNYQSAGSFRIKWDGKNEKGERVVSGIYVYQLKADEFVATKKMTLLR